MKSPSHAPELLAAILDTADCLILVLDPEGRIVEFNRACETASGFESGEVRGRLVWDALIPAEEIETVAGVFRQLLYEDSPNRYTNHWITKDGGRLLVSWSNTTVFDGAGNVCFVVATGIDETEFSLLEEANREAELYYRALVETMTDGLAVDDIDGNLTYVNDTVCEMLGHPREVLLGHPLIEYLDPESRRILESQNAIRFTDADREAYQLRIRRQDGSILDVLVSPQRLMGVDGKMTGSFAVMTDITEIKRMEEDRALLGTAIEQSAEAVVITDQGGTIRYVNPAFEEITGYSSAEAIGANPRILKSGRHDDAFYADLWATISGGQTWSGHFSNIRKDGTLFHEEASISPVRDDQNEIIAYVAVKRDVTAERELTMELNRTQKLEALGELAGGIAHDFNNLFMTIAGSTELLRLRLHADTEAEDELNTIHETVSRGADLTRRLLSAAQQQVLEMVVIDLNSLIREELHTLRRVLPESISVEFKPGPGKPIIRGDRNQIEQILQSLGANAKDAMTEGGTITLSTEVATADALVLAAHPYAKEGTYVRLSVEDTGKGMANDVRTRAFDPFFTTKSETARSGMGLATVYGIVRQHGGMVEVDSRPRVGTRFDLFFPLASESSEKADLASKESVGGSETILVVEDEERVRKTQARMLNVLGYVVLQAENGRVALDILERKGDAVDMVFSDVSMPEMGGQELFDRARELRPDLAFVFSSGYTGGEFIDWTHRREDVHFIGKPHTMAQLAEIIRKALEE